MAAHAGLGWVALDERFDDEGDSGATMDGPAFFRLLERVDARAVDRIVVTRVDRLTRRLSDWVWLLAQLRKRNVAVSIVTGQMASTEIAADSFVFNIMASFAEYEREIVSERVRDAHAADRLRGLRSAGRVPFGYRADPETRQLVVPEPEASVVRQMFALAQEGEPPTTIAAATNASASTRTWHARAVLRILQNPAYAGRFGLPPYGWPETDDVEVGPQPTVVVVAVGIKTRNRVRVGDQEYDT